VGNDSALYEMLQSLITHFRALLIYLEHLYTILTFENHSELCEYIQNFAKLFSAFEGY